MEMEGHGRWEMTKKIVYAEHIILLHVSAAYEAKDMVDHYHNHQVTINSHAFFKSFHISAS